LAPITTTSLLPTASRSARTEHIRQRACHMSRSLTERRAYAVKRSHV
jgi:hypothetical protein